MFYRKIILPKIIRNKVKTRFRSKKLVRNKVRTRLPFEAVRFLTLFLALFLACFGDKAGKKARKKPQSGALGPDHRYKAETRLGQG